MIDIKIEKKIVCIICIYNNIILFPMSVFVPVSNLSDDTCYICLDDIENDFTHLQCGHRFCTRCLQVIFTVRPNICPTCKVPDHNMSIFSSTIITKKRPTCDVPDHNISSIIPKKMRPNECST